MPFKLSNYHVASQAFVAADGKSTHLIYATRTGRTARLSGEVYRSLRAGHFDDLSDEMLSNLFDLELLVPADKDEFRTILERNRHAVANNKTLSVTIQPTANCQLGCSYCGQTHRKKNAGLVLGDKIVSRIVSNVDEKGYTGVGVMWFGAEPLMAYSEILRLSDRLIEACDARGIPYDAEMTTNGLSLKPEVFRQLNRRRCRRFQITLDGTAETHDRLRMTKTGLPTFETILGNIVAVTALDEFMRDRCRIALRMNVNKLSAHEVPALLERLASLGLHERRVVPSFQPVVEWGKNGASADSYSPAEFAEKEIEWILLSLKLGFKFFRFLPTRSTQPCMAVLPDGEVYDADGNVFPCYEFPYTESSSGPEYKLGHIDTIAEVRNETAVTRQWNTQIEGDVSPCKRCNLFPVCGGSCPKQWLHGERACPSFKDNIQDRLALHFLQKLGDQAAA